MFALGGTLAVGEYLAGALIALMLATGRTLEETARRRASHDLDALLAHAPHSARRRTDSGVVRVPLSEIVAGDPVIVGPGEAVPVDGRIEGTEAVLDESVLTGEPLQVTRRRGEEARSGAINAGGAFVLRATATEQDRTGQHLRRNSAPRTTGRRTVLAGRAAGRPVCRLWPLGRP
ncbi:hypothetical protein ABZ333_21465 [Streptomyces olivaceus]